MWWRDKFVFIENVLVPASVHRMKRNLVNSSLYVSRILFVYCPLNLVAGKNRVGWCVLLPYYSQRMWWFICLIIRRTFVATASKIVRPNTIYRVNVFVLPHQTEGMIVKALVTKDNGQHVASAIESIDSGMSHNLLLKVLNSYNFLSSFTVFQYFDFIFIVVVLSDSRDYDRRPVPIEIRRLRSSATAESRFHQTGIVGISPRFPIRSSPNQSKNIQKRNESSFPCNHHPIGGPETLHRSRHHLHFGTSCF